MIHFALGHQQVVGWKKGTFAQSNCDSRVAATVRKIERHLQRATGERVRMPVRQTHLAATAALNTTVCLKT